MEEGDKLSESGSGSAMLSASMRGRGRGTGSSCLLSVAGNVSIFYNLFILTSNSSSGSRVWVSIVRVLSVTSGTRQICILFLLSTLNYQTDLSLPNLAEFFSWYQGRLEGDIGSSHTHTCVQDD